MTAGSSWSWQTAMHNTSIHPLNWRVKLEKREGRSCIIWFWEFSPTIRPGSFFSDFAIGANASALNHFPALPMATSGYKKEQTVAGLLFILSEEGKAGGTHKPTRKWAPLLLFRKTRKRDQATKLSIAKYSIVKTVEMIPRVVIFSTVKMVAVLFILFGWESVAWWRGEIIA